MKIFSIIFIFFWIPAFTFAYSRFAFIHLTPDQKLYALQSGYISSEIEYEHNETVVSHYDAKYLRTEFTYAEGFSYDLTAKLTLSAGAFGTLEKTHDPSVNLPNHKIRFHGPQGFDFKLQKLLPFSNEQTKYAVQVGSRGSLLSAKETNLAYGGFDFHMSFHWSHKHRTHYFTGNVKSEIVGRKKTTLITGDKEITDAYSLLGAQIGYIYTTSSAHPFGFSLAPHFYHTTDYNTRNPNFNRITDKGFIWGAEIKFFKSLNENFDLFVSHMRESYIFNVVDSSVSGEIDYEIERNETYIGILWSY